MCYFLIYHEFLNSLMSRGVSSIQNYICNDTENRKVDILEGTESVSIQNPHHTVIYFLGGIYRCLYVGFEGKLVKLNIISLNIFKNTTYYKKMLHHILFYL